MSRTVAGAVIERRFGSVTRKAVAATLAEHASVTDDGEWWTIVGQKRIAAEAEISDRTVRTVLAEFESEGLIKRERRHRKDGSRTSDRILINEAAVRNLPEAVSAGLPEAVSEPTGRAIAAHEPSEEPTSPNGDGLFESFYRFWVGRTYVSGVRLPKSMRGRLNAAVKEARTAEITADEVQARGRRYVETWREMERTPQALLANWHRFEPGRPVPDCGECGNRGVIWFTRDGERAAWDSELAEEAAKCPACGA